MFGGWHMLVLEDDAKVDKYLRLAANHHLTGLYKVGVYGTERQHELFVKGAFWNYISFKLDIRETKSKKVS